MARTVFGFYDLDAAPQHGLPGDLATRLGLATETPGFVDGAVFVRSDNLAMAIQVQYGDEDGWEDRGSVSILLQAADWRSRTSDVARYRLTRQVDGDGEQVKDSTFFIVQRFVVDPNDGASFVDAICAYTTEYARPIPGFIGGDAYTSLDGSKIVFVMPWAHEAALGSLENRDGSLAAMQKHLRMSKQHVYASYQRISYLRAAAPEPEREPAGSGSRRSVS
ncbi:MAG: hypothetical protein IAI49_01745 [Candidatus Eremiobacteraeota bacterium]|nr:hypothetical protein [Candidatus Eremiobacteraeota bacterium]